MGFFQDIIGGGGANVGGLQAKQAKLIDRSNSLADMLMSRYNDTVRSGAYDPAAQLDLLKRDTEYSTGVNSKNAAGSAKILGYRAGDSEPMLQQRDLSERATLDYDKLANQIRTNAVAGQTDALNTAVGGASSIYSRGVDAYGGQIQTAIQQDQQNRGVFGTLLGAALPFVAPHAAVAKTLLGSAPSYTYPGGNRPGSFGRIAR